MSHPWMPFWVDKYLGDTGHLTTVEHGAYLLLILHYWRHGGLPDNEHDLARITKMDIRLFRKKAVRLRSFFADGWRHKRIDIELHRAETKSLKRLVAGQKGRDTQRAWNRLVRSKQ